ncbi:hypothetical protein BWZ22_15270 [Seonamhaeicola sp. S2-3]|uniref:DUF4412 domain-containing protein n=1 Tax=Seonamhaeicola sp. S2-3 TaxID=1936081 RepID=UPI000972AE66|nr:DUF4412 domain-containing protein [Seonamhaeicola sp. S2-3]APY12494.1 hypothetical protein BWZ22_15270 [Seonamhaeicola sp. S2-3]
MKSKNILLIMACLLITSTTQAQFLKKLKKKAEEAAERTILRKTDEAVSKKTEKTIDDVTTKKDKPDKEKAEAPETMEAANTALTKNTKTKKAFYNQDVVIQLRENGNLNQTQYFDANEVAVKLEQDDMPEPGYIDSEGFIYTYKNGEYTKSSIVALQSQGMMVPTMLIEAYKLPPEPFMIEYQKQTDQGQTANPFNGIVEFAFIYKPDDFRYEDYKESTQTLRGETYTKFEFLNEPGYEGSYVLFDNQDRLVEIYTKVNESKQNFEIGEMPREKGESLLVYDYKPVTVSLPQAREVRAQGQDLMEGVMKNIVKGGNQPKDDIDEDDYNTSDSKGMTKRIKKSLKEHKVSASDLPETYEFDWALQTQMTLNAKKKETMELTFLIKEGASYQATRMRSEESKNMGLVTMLFDMDLNTMIMFMDAQGSKFMQIHPIPDPGKTKENIDNYKISDLPTKTIIGYNCKGLQFEDERYVMKIYHTSEAGLRLPNFLNFGTQKPSNIPDMDPRVIEQFSKGLIMEMDIIDKKKSKNNVNIMAKALKKTLTTIEKSKYKTMALFSSGGMFKN